MDRFCQSIMDDRQDSTCSRDKPLMLIMLGQPLHYSRIADRLRWPRVLDGGARVLLKPSSMP
jgi:hypothetical protein